MARPLRILLVEDDDVDREHAVRLFSKFGEPIELSEAATLAEARERLVCLKFDCVLLDYHLRGDLGLDLIPNVLMHRPEICPVILVTFRESDNLIVDAMRRGVVDYIPKSRLTVERLREVVGGAIKRAETEQTQRDARAKLLETTEQLRKEQEDALRDAAAEAQRAARAKSMFVANMSHEIRTPLNAVIGLSYLLQRTSLSPDQSELVVRIKAASKALLVIVNNVLVLSRLGASALKLERVPVQIRRTLAEMTDLIAAQVERKDVAVRLEIAAEIPPALIGDPVRLHQVLGNLMNNAIKFTHEGSVTLRVSLLRRADERVRLRFEVEDTGIGIASEALQRLFKPFVQADDSTTRRYGGTGLGLSIAHELTLLMDGEIGADSRPGEGSTFWTEIEFDVAKEDVAPPAKTAVSPGVQRLHGVRVLLVDDSDVNLEVGKAILESEGAKVQTACDGHDAVQLVLAGRNAYDIVLMDLQMPVLDGHDAFARIAAVLGAARPVVVALTAGSLTDVSGEVGSGGMDGLMHKPFDVDELVLWIRSHVGLSDTPARAKTAAATAAWPEAPGIETAVARTLMGDNRRLFETALQIFVRQYDDIDALLTGKDLNEVARLMHRLKGGAGTIGAQTLSGLALRAEIACKSGGEDWASALRSVCDEFRQLRDHIRAPLAIGEPMAAA